jgi:hypothetical protein
MRIWAGGALRLMIFQVAVKPRHGALDGVNLTFGCARGIVDLTGEGTYTVNPDGTGVAKITFTRISDGTVIGTDTYDFIIFETTTKGKLLLATQVFAADQAGGLAGQLVAPTWTRISDSKDEASVAKQNRQE